MRPAVRFFAGRALERDLAWHIGFCWKLNENACPGELLYLRMFELWFAKSWPFDPWWRSMSFGYRIGRS